MIPKSIRKIKNQKDGRYPESTSNKSQGKPTKGKHTFHAGTSSTNGTSHYKLRWNLHRILKRLAWEVERGKGMGEFKNIFLIIVKRLKGK